MRPKRITTAALGAAGLLALGGCGSDRPAAAPVAPTPGQTSPERSPSNAPARVAPKISVKIIDTDFRPVSLTVKAGTTVRWKQTGDQPHSASAADESFDSSPDCGPLDADECLAEGSVFSHTFDKPGEFMYYCRVHGLPDGTGMVGTVIVK